LFSNYKHLDFLHSLRTFLRVKLGLNKKALLLFVTALLGVIVSFVAISLQFCVEFLSDITFKNENINQWYFIVPCIGGLFTGLVVYFFHPQKKIGGGVEDTIKSLRFKTHEKLFRKTLLRFAASVFTLGSGGSAGKEAPIVYLGGNLGALMGKIWRFPDGYVKTLSGAGVAAAIAAAFQAPIAGSFFALEILLANFSLDTFSMIIVAAVTSTAVSQWVGHISAHITTPHYIFERPLELFFFIGLGVFGGLINVFFIKTLHYMQSLFNKGPYPSWARPALGGLIIGVTGIFFPFVYGEGYDVINFLLKGDILAIERTYTSSMALSGIFVLILILFLKIFAVSMTIGSGGCGGTLVPALFFGTTVGAIWYSALIFFMPNYPFSPGTWALVGMSSVLAGMTNAPLFTIALFFELTKDYEVILPVMIVVSVSILVSKHFLKGASLYSSALEKEGIKMYKGFEQSVMESVVISDVMHRRINLIEKNASLGSVIQGFLHSPFLTGFVIDETNRYAGLITLNQIREYIEDKDLCNLILASEIARYPDIWLVPEENILQALEIMDKTDLDWLPILDKKTTKKPVGYITRKDVLSVYNQTVIKRGTQNILLDQDSQSAPQKLFNINDDFAIETYPVQKSWIKKTLKEIDLRAKFGLTVIGIKKENDLNNIIPDVQYELAQGDKLTLVGTHESFSKFKQHMDKQSKSILDYFSIKGLKKRH